MVKKKTDPHKIGKNNVQELRGQILDWYDRHGRDLPWRFKNGARPDPYRVWLSEVMLQQTTVPAVMSYYTKFLEQWPDLPALAAARQEDVLKAWAGLGYYSRARNLHACAVQIMAQGGEFPKTQKALKKLPGIGEYTSAALMAILHNQPAVVVDGNIERVVIRLFAIRTPMPPAKTEVKEKAALVFEDCSDRPGDLAQALMDLGSEICTPTRPSCARCPIAVHCRARAEGLTDALPARERKARKPQKRGYVYWIENGRGDVLLERRPQKGLFAGMATLPTSDWLAQKDAMPLHPPFLKGAAPGKSGDAIRHSFTHFDLALIPCRAELKAKKPPAHYFWVSKKEVAQAGLPSLFKKAANVFLNAAPRAIIKKGKRAA